MRNGFKGSVKRGKNSVPEKFNLLIYGQGLKENGLFIIEKNLAVSNWSD